MANFQVGNNTAERTISFCYSCMLPFGITATRIPLKCIEERCHQIICAQCVQEIIRFNGEDRNYRCMECFKSYPRGQQPKQHRKTFESLLKEAKINYGQERTNQLVLNTCTDKDLSIEISLRKSQLQNLINRAQSYSNDAYLVELSTHATDMASELSELLEKIKVVPPIPIDKIRDAYKQAISTSNNPNDLVMKYINICEELRFALVIIEQQILFPRAYDLKKEWSHKQGTGDDFEPEILELFKAIEKDLIDQWKSPKNVARVRIGLIGYTSAGKSTIANRLRRVTNLNEKDAASVSTMKCTFFPSEFDCSDPWTDYSHDPLRSTNVTIVDIQGLDENRDLNDTERQAGNYLDEIAKADCDIYVIVFNKKISEKQKTWIEFIENSFRRQCVLVRSKIDCDFLANFDEYHNKDYSDMEEKERRDASVEMIKRLRRDNDEGSQQVYVVAHTYRPNNEQKKLLSEESFDNDKLLNDLSRIAADHQPSRIAEIAFRALANLINTCFRRDYILNVLKYQIAADAVAVIPFADELPPYVARVGIRDTFGINTKFHKYLQDLNLTIYGYKLRTSVFEKTIKVEESLPNASIGSGETRRADFLAPLRTSRELFDFILWLCVSHYRTGRHIFYYTNELCTDILMISNEFICEIIRRQRLETAKSQWNLQTSERAT